MKGSKRLFVVLGIGLGLLLAACGGQTSGGGTTVTIRQQDSGPLVGAYYRVGGGSWQPITFSGGRATFTATGEYEVAVRCQSGPTVYTDLYLFKATVRQATALSFACEASSAGTSSQTFNVTLPRNIGSQAVQLGDAVFVGTGSGEYQGSNPVSVTTNLPDGRQDVLLTLLRATGGPPPTSLTPIGYKLAQNLNVSSGGTYAVDDTGWQPFAATRSIRASFPQGYQGFAMAFFFRDGMKVPGIVGGIDRYGTLALSGKYLGMAQAEPSTGRGSQLFALKDTGGADWTPSLMSPWGAGQFSVNGDTLTFAHPQAQSYLFQAFFGLLKDSASGSALKVHITVYPSGATTTYTVPMVPGLGYALEDPTARSVSFALTAYRGNPAQAGLLLGGGTPTERDLAGLDVASAQTSDLFNGPSYTLP